MTTRPKAPHDLDPAQKAEWERLCDELDSLGLLDKTDRSILTLYVHQWDAHQQAADHVHANGLTVDWPNGATVQSPQYKSMKETAVTMRGLLGDMGLTAKARAKAKPKAQPDDGQIEF